MTLSLVVVQFFLLIFMFSLSSSNSYSLSRTIIIICLQCCRTHKQNNQRDSSEKNSPQLIKTLVSLKYGDPMILRIFFFISFSQRVTFTINSLA